MRREELRRATEDKEEPLKKEEPLGREEPLRTEKSSEEPLSRIKKSH